MDKTDKGLLDWNQLKKMQMNDRFAKLMKFLIKVPILEIFIKRYLFTKLIILYDSIDTFIESHIEASEELL